MLGDDSNRLSSYHIYSLFPFGRMIKDIHAEGNLLEVPEMAFEKLLGLPVHQIGRQLRASKDEDE